MCVLHSCCDGQHQRVSIRYRVFFGLLSASEEIQPRSPASFVTYSPGLRINEEGLQSSHAQIHNVRDAGVVVDSYGGSSMEVETRQCSCHESPYTVATFFMFIFVLPPQEPRLHFRSRISLAVIFRHSVHVNMRFVCLHVSYQDHYHQP